MPQTRLIPNLGAEEGDAWRNHLDHPAVATTARLWRMLFASPTAFVGLNPTDATQDAQPDASSWPLGAEASAQTPVFDWLDPGDRITPWLATSETTRLAESLQGSLAAADAETVARVHDKAFAASEAQRAGYLPRCLEGLIHAFDPADLAASDFATRLQAIVRAWPDWTGGRFTLKPRHGSSGRGRVAGNAADLDLSPLRGALARLAERGGVLLEPWLDRTADLSVVLRVAPAEGEQVPITLLGSLLQWVSESGVYRGHLGELDSRGRVFTGHEQDEAVREAAVAIAAAARDAGFFGPCGVDSFVFRLSEQPGSSSDNEVREVLRPVVELNARFTAGIIAVGLVRRFLPRVRAELQLGPGERRAFLFALDVPPGRESWDEIASEIAGDPCLIPLWREHDVDRPALLFTRELEALRALTCPE